MHAQQLKKEKEAVEKQIMADGLIHKNGKKYEPFTNKEVDDAFVKLHTKKDKKKHVP